MGLPKEISDPKLKDNDGVLHRRRPKRL